MVGLSSGNQVMLEHLPDEAREWMSSTYLSHIDSFSDVDPNAISLKMFEEIPEEGQRTYQLKHCEYNNKDEDNSPKPWMIKRELSYIYMYVSIAE